jgi:hypothetical protein
MASNNVSRTAKPTLDQYGQFGRVIVGANELREVTRTELQEIMGDAALIKRLKEVCIEAILPKLSEIRRRPRARFARPQVVDVQPQNILCPRRVLAGQDPHFERVKFLTIGEAFQRMFCLNYDSAMPATALAVVSLVNQTSDQHVVENIREKTRFGTLNPQYIFELLLLHAAGQYRELLSNCGKPVVLYPGKWGIYEEEWRVWFCWHADREGWEIQAEPLLFPRVWPSGTKFLLSNWALLG